MANDSAIHARAHILPAVVAEFEDACVSQLEQQKHLQHMFNFHLAANKRMAQLHQEQKHEDSVMGTPRPTWEQLKTFQIDDPWQPPIVRLNWTRHSAWGPTISQLMLQWMMQFRWPREARNDDVTAIGISWYELVLFFMRFSELFSLCGNRISRGGRS